ncbi:outer membrane protein assembly factor BamC [Niveibacterium terrae]|uniref:outer membrane protein assembly factor BamC n=1 Tax=Niveibacterium terrae TaxID=3373598 RepID=UPI003A8F37B8
MKKLRYQMAPLCVLFAVGACSSINQTVTDASKIDYKSGARQRPTALEVPPDLTRPGRDERYALEGESASTTFSDFQAGNKLTGMAGASSASLGVLPEIGNLSIGRAGNERWLIVPGTPEQVWTRMRQFWLDNGFTLTVDSPELGLLETDWVENRAKIKNDIVREVISKVWDGAYTSPEKDRYRARIEPGLKAGTVEIFISHRGLEEVLVGAQKDSSRWEWRPSDPGLEAEMLRKMMLSLGLKEDRARELMMTVQATDHARFERATDGGAVLVFADPIEQAWRQVGLALDRSGLLVEERDSTLGIYDVRAAGSKAPAAKKKEEGGWFSWLKFGESTEVPVQEVKPGALPVGASYRVFVKGDTKLSQVRILDKDGNLDKSDDANKVLKLLFEQLK